MKQQLAFTNVEPFTLWQCSDNGPCDYVWTITKIDNLGRMWGDLLKYPVPQEYITRKLDDDFTYRKCRWFTEGKLRDEWYHKRLQKQLEEEEKIKKESPLHKLLDRIEECRDGNLREKVARFIDKRPETTHFRGVQYYTYEDALVEFIADILEDIIKEEK